MKQFLLITTSFTFFVLRIFSQTIPQMEIYHLDEERFITYIADTLFGGGGKILDVKYTGNIDGRDVFNTGASIGFQNGVILANGWVMSTINIDGGDNKNGHQTNPERDSLGPYNQTQGLGLYDADMDWLLGILAGDNKSDTTFDPSSILIKFKPFYNTIKMRYVFASEEYKYDKGLGGGDPNDIDFTGSNLSDFMLILLKRSPGERDPKWVLSCVGRNSMGNPPRIPVSVKYVNHNYPELYKNNLDKPHIFDGQTIPLELIRADSGYFHVSPCRTYWMKIGVADYPNGVVLGGYNLSHLANSAVFLEAGSFVSGTGLEWTVTGQVDNPDFASDTSLVEGGCSSLLVNLKLNTQVLDTVFIRFKITGADAGEFTVSPPPFQDSLLYVPPLTDSATFLITAVDDNINEGTNGIEKWFFRYQIDPCDVPSHDTSGWGTNTQGYSGYIIAHIRDYYPIVDSSKTYGPVPSSIYFCGNNVTVSATDIVRGGIPPFSYLWTHPAASQFGSGDNFTTPIVDNPDYVFATVTDRCTDKPGYAPAHDTVIIYSQLTVQASPDFQLCQFGQTAIKVQTTNVGRNFTTVWYFQGNPVGYDSIYLVTWAEYGIYAPNTLTFTCEVTDFCGNVSSDLVNASFFPLVEITGPPLICLGESIQLNCSNGQTYQWYLNAVAPGNQIPGAIQQVLIYTPAAAGFYTVCVQILNECGELADTCFSFQVSELICQVSMNGGNNFTVCPGETFSLEELNATSGWEWDWIDNGMPQNASGQQITLSMITTGPHLVTVSAYNEYGCYDVITFNVTVFPYTGLQVFTQFNDVCEGFPTQLSTQSSVQVSSWLWTADPPDPTLTGQENLPAPIVAPTQTSEYSCFVNDVNGCQATVAITVTVRPPLAGTIMTSTPDACTGDQIIIDFVGNDLPNSTYSWTFQDGNPAMSTLKQPTVVWDTPGLKSIHIDIDEPGCFGSFDLQFQVNVLPEPAFSIDVSSGCTPLDVRFTNLSTNIVAPATYEWDFGDGNVSQSVEPDHTYDAPGLYSVTLNIINATGCQNSIVYNNYVEAYPVPVADFSAYPEAATIDNPKITFTNQIGGDFSIIQWDFGDGNTSTELNPVHFYSDPGTYTVIMYTESIHGCNDADTMTVSILKELKIFVPNAFSPDGDGLNDCFGVGGTIGDIIDKFTVIIFSRTGQMVFSGKISNPDCVWDGRNLNGEKLPAETYVYRIIGRDYRDKPYVYEGTVTMIE